MLAAAVQSVKTRPASTPGHAPQPRRRARARSLDRPASLSLVAILCDPLASTPCSQTHDSRPSGSRRQRQTSRGRSTCRRSSAAKRRKSRELLSETGLHAAAERTLRIAAVISAPPCSQIGWSDPGGARDQRPGAPTPLGSLDCPGQLRGRGFIESLVAVAPVAPRRTGSTVGARTRIYPPPG